MEKGYQEIDSELLKRVKADAWSIESMEGHGAGGREVTYIGSEINGYLDNEQQKGLLIYDYYQDDEGDYWFKNRALLPDGRIVSMEYYIFGRKLKKYSRPAKRKK